MKKIDIYSFKIDKKYKASSFKIANYIIYKYTIMNRKINNLMLQCILYYIQISGLKNGIEIINDEFITGDYCPIVKNIYAYYEKYHLRPIDEINICECNIEPNVKKIIDSVIYEKINYRLIDMLKELSGEYTAWYTLKNAKNMSVIPISMIATEEIEILKKYIKKR